MMGIDTLAIHCLQSEVLFHFTSNIFSLLTFVVKNLDAFKSNSPIHSTNTRQSFDLHPPTNLTKAQKQY